MSAVMDNEIVIMLTPIESQVIELKRQHTNTWRNHGQVKWTLGLLEEVSELLLALVGLHHHSPDWEMRQIATIAMNWLERREEQGGKNDGNA